MMKMLLLDFAQRKITFPLQQIFHKFKKNINKLFFIGLYLFSSPLEADFSFPFQVPQNFPIFMRTDLVIHPVSTSNPEAQRYFNQGLLLIYAFNHDAAYWSFKKAAEIDPNLAMAYWGMALAMGPNINTDITKDREDSAFDLSQKALKLSTSATDNEKAYIQALSKRYSNDPNADKKKLSQDYFDAMKGVVKTYQDDLDAATLYAESGLDLDPWNQWDDQWNPRPGTLHVVEVLESVLKRNPDHLGANHYYIHAIEASSYPERALMSAERLRHMLPNAGHILHMPAHVYLLVGDYHQAVLCNVKAIAADKAYIQQFGFDGMYPLHYLSHNYYFLSRAYSMEGRFDDAKKIADEMVNFYFPHFQAMPDLEYYIPTPLFVLVRFNKWQDILAYPAPSSQMQVSNTLWYYARGIAHAALGDTAAAQEEQKLFVKSKDALPKDIKFGYNDAAPIIDIADLTLKAKIAESQNDKPSAIQYLQLAVAVQDQLHYNEPPDWSFPVRESLGGAFLRNKQYTEAEQVFREDLKRHPRNGRALFGLLESLKAQSRQADAYWIQTEFDKAWKYSTTPLSIETL